MRVWLRSALFIAVVFAGLVAFFHFARADAIRPLGGSSLGSSTPAAPTQASGSDGIQVNGAQNVTATSPFQFDLASTLTFDTIMSNPAQPITLDAANGIIAAAAGDRITADLATLTNLTASIVTTANATVTFLYTNVIGPRGSGILQLNNWQGVSIADDGGSNASRLVPSAGLLLIDAPGVVRLGTTGNVTLDAAFVTNSQAGGAGAVHVRDADGFIVESAGGLILKDDALNSSVTLVATNGANTIVTVAIQGTGIFQISGNDRLGVNTIEPTNLAGALTLRPTAGGAGVIIADSASANGSTFSASASALNVDIAGATGALIIAAGDTLTVNAIHPTTANVTLTLGGDGADGGVLIEASDLLAATQAQFTTATIGTLSVGTTTTLKLITTSVTATTIFVDTLASRTGDTVSVDPFYKLAVARITGNTGAIVVSESGGIILSLDDTSAASTLVPSTNAVTINIDGSGSLVIPSGDQITVNAITTTTNNTSLMLTGAGTGGVTFGTEPVSIANGPDGGDANGDILSRIGGIYRRIGLGSAGQALIVNAGGTGLVYGTAAASITAKVSGTSFTGTTTLEVTGDVTASQSGATTTVTVSQLPFLGPTVTVSSSLDGVSAIMTADNLVLGRGTTGGVTETRIMRNLSATCNMSTAGPIVNGRDQSAAFSDNSWIYCYAISGESVVNATTFSANRSRPVMPSGYTHACMIFPARVNTVGAAGPGNNANLTRFIGSFRHIDYPSLQLNVAVSSGTDTTFTVKSVAKWVPPLSWRVSIFGLVTGSAGNALQIQPFLSTPVGSYFMKVQSTGIDQSNFISLPTDQSQNLYYKVTSAGESAFIYVTGFDF